MTETLDMDRLAAMNSGWLGQVADWPDIEAEDAYTAGFEAGERFANQRAQRQPLPPLSDLPGCDCGTCDTCRPPIDLMPYAGLTKAEFEQTQDGIGYLSQSDDPR